MNKYGLMAQEHWQRHAPSRYAALENPEAYFTELGESAAAEILQVETQLEQSVPADLPYLERVGQLRAIQKQAEELVLTDLVYSVSTEPSGLAEELELILGALPSVEAVRDFLWSMKDRQDEETSAGRALTEDQQASMEQAESLLPLLMSHTPPEEMTEAELRDRILALEPFLNRETGKLRAV